MSVIKVIVGSTRPNRFGIQPASWLMELAKEHPEATFELIDLADVNLPFLDEPKPPAAGNYANDHTKAWAKIIGDADGYIFVTAEYNHGVPAALKNAIDFLAREWYYKPAAFVSYGAGGGGVRAVEHLRSTLTWLRVYSLHDEVALYNYWSQLDDKGAFAPSEQQIADAHRLLTNIVFWATELKPIREKLA